MFPKGTFLARALSLSSLIVSGANDTNAFTLPSGFRPAPGRAPPRECLVFDFIAVSREDVDVSGLAGEVGDGFSFRVREVSERPEYLRTAGIDVEVGMEAPPAGASGQPSVNAEIFVGRHFGSGGFSVYRFSFVTHKQC